MTARSDVPTPGPRSRADAKCDDNDIVASEFLLEGRGWSGVPTDPAATPPAARYDLAMDGGRATRNMLEVVGLVAVTTALAACAPAATATTHISGDHDGLTLTADVSTSSDTIVVDAVVHNGRDETVYLVPDQCGHVIDAELERTVSQPEGQTCDGSIQAVKDLVLEDQRSDQFPDPFWDARVADPSSGAPECQKPYQPTTLAPGDEIDERRVLPLASAFALAEVGSDDMRIGLEAVEARDPDTMEYLDILPQTMEDADRVGRVVRAELPASAVIDREPTRPLTGPSKGELFDRLLADEQLRAWIEAQPADGWALAELRPAIPDAGPDYADLRLRLLNTAYERAARVVARADGSDPNLTLPGEADRTRTFERRPGTLPPGIALIPEPDGYSLSDDLLLGDIALPSGRVVVGEYLLEQGELDLAVAPGRYPVYATLARYQDQALDGVSYATLVLSDAPTVRWEDAGTIAVDGGTTTIISPEGRDLMRDGFDRDQDAWTDENDVIFESVIAHDWLGTTHALTPELDLAMVSSGIGDGGYPVWIGRDAIGAPTQVVVDFYLLHLDWPVA